jgi:penicillin-binding protein 1A
MQEGMSPCDKVVNVPQTFIVNEEETWTPASTDKDEWIGQTVTLKWGLTKSSNNISAYLMKQFGPYAMVDMMRKMGIGCYLDPVNSLCVGAADIAVYEMVSAYNSFPSRGVYVSPIFVTRIEDSMGNVLGEFTNHKREAISEYTAYLMANLMQGVVNSGTGVRLKAKYGLTGEIAGKTGTTNDQSDGWFIGYTPSLTAGVWVGAEDRQVHFESLSLGGGSNMALPIWGIFMQKCRSDKSLGMDPEEKFMAPPGITLDLNCDGSDADAAAKAAEEGYVEEESQDYFFD